MKLEFEQTAVVVQLDKDAIQTRPFSRLRSLRAGSVVSRGSTGSLRLSPQGRLFSAQRRLLRMTNKLQQYEAADSIPPLAFLGYNAAHACCTRSYQGGRDGSRRA